MSRTCTTSAAHRGQVLFPADPRLFRRCLRLPRPRRPCWNRYSCRWRRQQEPPAGASIPAAAPVGCPAPVPSGFPFPADRAAPARRSARCRRCRQNRLCRCFRLRRFRHGRADVYKRQVGFCTVSSAVPLSPLRRFTGSPTASFSFLAAYRLTGRHKSGSSTMQAARPSAMGLAVWTARTRSPSVSSSQTNFCTIFIFSAPARCV